MTFTQGFRAMGILYAFFVIPLITFGFVRVDQAYKNIHKEKIIYLSEKKLRIEPNLACALGYILFFITSMIISYVKSSSI